MSETAPETITYTGRFAPTDHARGVVGDDLDGPTTMALIGRAKRARIDDPSSFPWHLASGVTTVFDLDMSRCDNGDRTSLDPVLGVLTPEDRLDATDDSVESPTIVERHQAKAIRLGWRSMWEDVLRTTTGGRQWRGPMTWVLSSADEQPADHHWLTNRCAPHGWIETATLDQLEPDRPFATVAASAALPEVAAAIAVGGTIAIRFDDATGANAFDDVRQQIQAAWGSHQITETVVTAPGGTESTKTIGAIVAIRRLAGSSTR